MSMVHVCGCGFEKPSLDLVVVNVVFDKLKYTESSVASMSYYRADEGLFSLTAATKTTEDYFQRVPDDAGYFAPIVDANSVYNNKGMVIRFTRYAWPTVSESFLGALPDFREIFPMICIAFDTAYPYVDRHDGKVYAVNTKSEYAEYLRYVVDVVVNDSRVP